MLKKRLAALGIMAVVIVTIGLIEVIEKNPWGIWLIIVGSLVAMVSVLLAAWDAAREDSERALRHIQARNPNAELEAKVKALDEVVTNVDKRLRDMARSQVFGQGQE